MDRNYPPKRWVWLSGMINEHGWKTGIEVGVKEGENLSYILGHSNIEHMYAVDPWVEQPGETEDYRNWNMQDIQGKCVKSIEPYKDRVTIVKEFSVDAAKHLPDVDFIFIDAQHNYKNLIKDIEAWRHKCKFLSGHDYWTTFPGIEKAVNDSFLQSEINLAPNTCWYVWMK